MPDDFAQWAAQLDEDEPETDRGFLWDPPATAEEAKRRGDAMLGNVLDRWNRQAIKAGFGVGERAPCVICGHMTTWRDASGLARHPRCGE